MRMDLPFCENSRSTIVKSEVLVRNEIGVDDVESGSWTSVSRLETNSFEGNRRFWCNSHHWRVLERVQPIVMCKAVVRLGRMCVPTRSIVCSYFSNPRQRRHFSRKPTEQSAHAPRQSTHTAGQKENRLSKWKYASIVKQWLDFMFIEDRLLQEIWCFEKNVFDAVTKLEQSIGWCLAEKIKILRDILEEIVDFELRCSARVAAFVAVHSVTMRIKRKPFIFPFKPISLSTDLPYFQTFCPDFILPIIFQHGIIHKSTNLLQIPNL